MPRSAPGSERGRRRQAGFTLIELIVVITLIAIASGVAALALRDPAESRLEQEAARLSALLESARAEARALGLPARWVPRTDDGATPGFRFVGLPAATPMPGSWLHEGVTAEVPGARVVVLGPEPMIGAQRIVLRLDDRQIVLATDGLSPFEVEAPAAVPAEPAR